MASFGGVQLTTPEDFKSDWGKWLIHGPQGSGKTTLASTIAELGKTLFLDMTGEHGIRSFQGAPYVGNITIARPTSVTALDDIFWELQGGDHDFKAVVIDSLTSVQKMAMRFLMDHDETAVREIRKGGAPADQRTWGQALDIMQDIATFWFGLADGERDQPIHVVMTAQTKIKENEDGNQVRTPDVQPGALSLVLANPDYILYTEVEENMEALADDTEPPVQHIVRFGADPAYRIKARVPVNLRGKIPQILGRKKPLSLADLSRVLGVGGVPTRSRAQQPARSNA